MGDSVQKTKTFTKPFVPQKEKDQRNPLREWKGKTKLGDETRGGAHEEEVVLQLQGFVGPRT
jgi:hypothetical protein